MRFHATIVVACAVGAMLAVMPRAAGAQETRTAAIAAEQAEKATRLTPRVPTTPERLIARARRRWVEQPGGFYPHFGSVYSGGGFTLGAGYRRFLGDRISGTLAGLYSVKNYKLFEVSVLSPGHAAGRIDARATAGWRDATQVAFHGLGIDSPADGSAFRMQQTYAGGDLILRPVKNVVIGAGGAYEDYVLKSPGGGLTFVEDVHTADSAPGIGENPAFVHTTISTGYDWRRPSPGYARSGGLYELAHHHYFDGDDTYSFDRLDADVVQHLPILRETWVVSLHGRLQTTLGDDDLVPYFLLPSLGSGGTLRGYSSWRFRDRHSLLLSAEWRWIPSRLGFDMALFYDAGTVANRLDAIALDDLVDDFGIGARFHTLIGTPLRVELAKGDEGVRIVFAASTAF